MIERYPKLNNTLYFLYEEGTEDRLYFDAIGLQHTLKVPKTGTAYFHNAERRGKPVDIVVLAALMV